MQDKTKPTVWNPIAFINQSSVKTKEDMVYVTAIFAVTVTLFLPVMRGRSFSMVAAHMFAQYPWTGIIKATPEIKGRGFPQTDHAEFFYPTSVFATNAIQSGQLPMWLP